MSMNELPKITIGKIGSDYQAELWERRELVLSAKGRTEAEAVDALNRKRNKKIPSETGSRIALSIPDENQVASPIGPINLEGLVFPREPVNDVRPKQLGTTKELRHRITLPPFLAICRQNELNPKKWYWYIEGNDSIRGEGIQSNANDISRSDFELVDISARAALLQLKFADKIATCPEEILLFQLSKSSYIVIFRDFIVNYYQLEVKRGNSIEILGRWDARNRVTNENRGKRELKTEKEVAGWREQVRRFFIDQSNPDHSVRPDGTVHQ